jgi:hypothetical protein
MDGNQPREVARESALAIFVPVPTNLARVSLPIRKGLKMKKRIIAIIGTTALAVGIAAAGVTSSFAATSADCQAGQICLYEQDNYNGDMFWTVNDRPNRDLRGTNMNDRTSSVWNRTDRTWCLSQDPNYFGWGLLIGPGESIYSLSNKEIVSDDRLGTWNDRVSSLRVHDGSHC